MLSRDRGIFHNIIYYSEILKKFLLIIWSEKKTTPFRVVYKSYARYKKHGIDGMIVRLNKEYKSVYPNSRNSVSDKVAYKKWIKFNEVDIDLCENLIYEPLISIVIPVYNTDKKYLKEMLDSVFSQTYKNYELCIADDASSNSQTVELIEEYENRYDNVKVVYRKSNGHISEASNSALKLAEGEYVVFLDHDDTLAINAIYEMVKKLNENRELRLIYSDEDKIDENGKRYNPHFKSGWNPAMFYSQNYLCHLVCLKKDIIDDIGGFRKGYEGSQDYDLLIRYIDKIKECQIDRVEKILYHWRAIKGSTAYGSGEKVYAHEAGLKALKDYFKSKDKNISVDSGFLPNTYKVNYAFEKPLVSLLIPTRDNYEILHKCVDSILAKTSYLNYEILVLDNETSCQKTLDYFKKITKHKNIKILEYHHPFNYSAINNFGVKHAKGEIIGLVNNDVEVISEGWLSEMVSYVMRDETGAVGAKLYYDNNTVQHAGVIIGIGGVAGHSHKYFDKSEYGYFSRLKIVQNYSAVTGACLLVKKELYEEVGGLDEVNLKVAFNDVDFCLKLLEKGYKNIWTPYVELYHHESISRGSEDNPEKEERFKSEVAYMKSRWLKYIESDKYYNCNLTKRDENFELNIDKVKGK